MWLEAEKNIANAIGRLWDTVNFQVEYSWFEFKFFLQTKAKEASLFDYLLIDKVGDCSRVRPKGSFFNSYYAEV